MLVNTWGKCVEEVIKYLRDMMPRGKIQNPVGFLISAVRDQWDLEKYDYRDLLNKKQEKKLKKQELEREKMIKIKTANPEVAQKYLKQMKEVLGVGEYE